MEMFMSFAVLHGVQFYVYRTLGDANIENASHTDKHTKGQPSHTYPKWREFIEILKERKERELKFHLIFLTNFSRSLWKKHWQNFILTASWKLKSTTWTWLMPWLSKSSSSFSFDSVVAMIFRSVDLTNSLRLVMRVVMCSHFSLGSSGPCE